MHLNHIKRIRMEYTGDFALAERIRTKLIEDGWRSVKSWTGEPVTWSEDIRREPIIGKVVHGVPIGVYR